MEKELANYLKMSRRTWPVFTEVIEPDVPMTTSRNQAAYVLRHGKIVDNNMSSDLHKT